MKRYRLSYAKQAGLTLLEMSIAMGLIVIIIAAMVLGSDQDQRKAELLQARLQMVQAGVLRFQMDLPCGASKLSALLLREDAAAGLCGDANNLDNWHGPYIDAGSMYVNNGELDLTPIVAGASMSVAQETVGTDVYTLIKVNGLTQELRSALIARCGEDCTPYKNLTNDEVTVGAMVSKVRLQPLPAGNYDIAPLTNVCRPGNSC